MISISPAEAVIIVGVIQGFLGLGAPSKLLAWQKLDATTLTITGVFVGLIGLALKVVLG